MKIKYRLHLAGNFKTRKFYGFHCKGLKDQILIIETNISNKKC